MKIAKVGIIGAGQMGSGIAHICALAGHNVRLHDVAPDRIDYGLVHIAANMARSQDEAGVF